MIIKLLKKTSTTDKCTLLLNGVQLSNEINLEDKDCYAFKSKGCESVFFFLVDTNDKK